MYYEKIINEKSNEWILFIHGLGGSMNTWKKQLENFKDKFNLLLIDLDGHGKSSAIKNKKNHSYKPEEETKSIYNILKENKIEKVNLISLSLGTIVALEFMAKHPECVNSSILAGCIINLDKKRTLLLSFVQKIKLWLPKTFLYNVFANILLPKKNHKKSREIFIKEAIKMNRQSFLEWLDSFNKSRHLLENHIKTINANNIPTLFVMGNEDYMFLKGIKNLKYKINDFKLFIIQRCGHVCSIEKSDIFNKLAKDFILQNT